MNITRDIGQYQAHIMDILLVHLFMKCIISVFQIMFLLFIQVKETLKFTNIMKEFNSELSEVGFVRCHRSYMVNLQHILVMRKDFVFVLDDAKRTTIPIGIRYKHIAETAFLNYI